MAAELITPVDELSGIPLPILPQEFLPYNDPRKANWHHPWHASTAPELTDSLGGRALRHSRVQLVRATDHNQGDRTKGKLTYHDFYIGPELPTDEMDQFRMCVIAAAGYVPDKAIDLRGDEPQVTKMNRQQLSLLRRSADPNLYRRGEMKRFQAKAEEAYGSLINPGVNQQQYVSLEMAKFRDKVEHQARYSLHHLTYSYSPMRSFFRDLVLRQQLPHVDETQIEKFLLARSNRRKRKIGIMLLEQAAEVAADVVEEPYKQLSSAGKLHPEMPDRATTLVLDKLGTPETRMNLLPEFEKRLKVNYGLVAGPAT